VELVWRGWPGGRINKVVEMIRALIEYTPELELEQRERLFQCKLNMDKRRWLTGAELGAAVAVIVNLGWPDKMLFCLVLVGVGALWLAVPWIGFKFSRTRVGGKAARGVRVELIFAEEEVRSRAKDVETRFAWETFSKVVRFADGVLLFQNPNWVSWVPFNCLEGVRERERLEVLLRRKISRYVDYRD
jgi:hypothetical protein